MALPVNWSPLVGWTGRDPKVVSVECSVVTGFEPAAQREVHHRLGVPTAAIVPHQGRVIFDIALTQVSEVLSLRTIDNAWILVGVIPEMDLTGPETETLDRLIALLPDLDWSRGLAAWRRVFNRPHLTFDSDLGVESEPVKRVKVTETETETDSTPLDPIPAFRCTCYRTGSGHAFSSMDAAKAIGGAIQDKFQWRVRMKDFDIEVVVNIDISQVYFSIGLTHVSLFKRNIEHFGPTTLRATICSSLLKLADIQPGDIVVDPMCGGGSIPIEGALGYKQGFYLAGDYHDLACERTKSNIRALVTRNAAGLPMDGFQWDVTSIPLKTASVDVFVTDLPFGKRSGSKADNRVLYPKVLLAMARVVKPNSGRAVLLTQDKTSMFKSMGKFNAYWKTTKQSYCNIGGLAALVFEMTRTDKMPDESSS